MVEFLDPGRPGIATRYSRSNIAFPDPPTHLQFDSYCCRYALANGLTTMACRLTGLHVERYLLDLLLCCL